uniref:BMERB domain-containing protein n=2 Tax=Clastoptera arizonana TaxID=38151 RepID=A0A1B6DSR6_9HEMI
MTEEEIGDKGGGTIFETKSVNIVNENISSLDKDIQLSNPLETDDSLISLRSASLVGVRRMMFENISHTDDEKLPKLKRQSYEKYFPESQVKCDITSDFSAKNSSENSVCLNVSAVSTESNDEDKNNFIIDKRRFSDISYIDRESDQDDSSNGESNRAAEKNAPFKTKSNDNKESELNVESVTLVLEKTEETDKNLDKIEDNSITSHKEDKGTEISDTLSLLNPLENLTKQILAVELTDDDTEGGEENNLVEASNDVVLDKNIVEAKNEFCLEQNTIEAKNDILCQDVKIQGSNEYIYTDKIDRQSPRPVPADIINIQDIPIPPARGKHKEKETNIQSTSQKPTDHDYPESLNPFGDDDDEENDDNKIKNESTNPFNSDDDDDDNDKEKSVSERPTPHQRKLLQPPKISLNPFGSDSEEEFSDENHSATPVPKPRTIRTPEPSPLPRNKMRGSSNSIGSLTSLASRKKKPAPLPPSQNTISRKARLAPKPPVDSRSSSPQPPPLPLTSPPSSPTLSLKYIPSGPQSLEKIDKDYVNRQRQNSETSSISSFIPHKSTYGQWKRKKGPAPALPIPQRRQVKPMPIKDIRQELDDIEIKQQELERQGVKLEQTIRDKFEQETSLTPYVEEMVLQLFELVNEKNDLFRRQAELMYLRRQHNLEEEHAELEYQIRCLMLCPDHNKTDSDKEREEELIQRLVEVVERRDEIIQCLEMDRLRETEEDRSVNKQLGIFSAAVGSELDMRTKPLKKGKKNKKDKRASKRDTLDVDKDLDEQDVERKKHKKKWFTLHHKM